MNHTIGVVAHTSRADYAHHLMDTVSAAYLSMDGEPNMGCNTNHHRTWQWLHKHATTDWAILLEDDAVPVPRFRTHAHHALNAAPTPIVSFYRGHSVNHPEREHQGTQAGTKADNHNAHWILADELLHAVAVAIRTDHITSMLNHITQLPHFLPIDEAITHWAQPHQHRIAYTWPSLCDHQDGPPAITRHWDKLPRPKGRTAYQTGTRTTWTSKAVTL